jgi:regulatory protein
LSAELQIVAMDRRPRTKRLAATLSDGSTLSVTADIAASFRLTAGARITAERLQEVEAAQQRDDAMAAALRLVAFRPRSEKEMRQALARRGIRPDRRDEAVARLRELGLLDDRAFAATFVESRDRSSPRSRRLVAQELRQKGVARDLAAGAAEAVDDADAAYRAAQRRARSVHGLAYPDFERRLAQFLLRRGFSYETTRSTVRKLWSELSMSAGEELQPAPNSP